MLNSTGFFTATLAEAEQAVTARSLLGWRIFQLPASMSSREEFFEAIRRVFPLDPPLQTDRSWDALADSLWAGLDRLPERKIVILWRGASRMRECAPEDFNIATSIFMELPNSLANAEMTVGNVKELLVLRVI